MKLIHFDIPLSDGKSFTLNANPAHILFAQSCSDNKDYTCLFFDMEIDGYSKVCVHNSLDNVIKQINEAMQ